MLAELIATPGVEEIVARRSRVGVMALHGGLEDRTADIAAEVSRQVGASLYAVVQPDDLRWHVPSIEYDPAASPALRDFLEHVTLAVSFHGFGRRGMEDTVLLGGSNRRAAALLAASLRERTGLRIVDELDDMPAGLRGMHPRNPVNLPADGGVQVELSPGAREPSAAADVAGAVAAALAAC